MRKKGWCKGNDTERKNSDAQADCAEQRPQTAGMEAEGRGVGGVKYLVVVRYMLKGWTDFRTITREFNDKSAADSYAREMYEEPAQEITVLVYELIESLN